MFKTITYSANLGTVVARVNHLTGELQLNSELWPRMSNAHRDYVLAHEETHLETGLTDETLVTQLALMKFVQGINDSNRLERENFLDQMASTVDKPAKQNNPVMWSNADDPVSAIANAVGDLSNLVGAFVNKRIAKIKAALARDQMSHEELMYEMYMDQQQRDNALAYYQTSVSSKVWVWLLVIMVMGAALVVFYKKTV